MSGSVCLARNWLTQNVVEFTRHNISVIFAKKTKRLHYFEDNRIIKKMVIAFAK